MKTRVSKRSIGLSMAMAVLLLVICAAGCAVMPWLARVLIDLPDTIGSRETISEVGRAAVLILAYGILADVMAVDVLMILLLRRVRAGLVFTDRSVALVRGMSWGCVALCGIFCLLGIWFQLAFFVAAAVLFLALCVRVVNNVLEEATRIKNENDMTV